MENSFKVQTNILLVMIQIQSLIKKESKSASMTSETMQ